MDPMTMSALSGMSGLDMGGGAITPTATSGADNKGGENWVGGTTFGSYNEAKAPDPIVKYTPWIIGGVFVLGVLYILKGGAK